MPVMKRATQQITETGLEVRKGLYGYYLSDPALRKQTGAHVYKTAAECVEAAKGGQRPRPF